MASIWEHGSDLHWLQFEPVEGGVYHPWNRVTSSMFGSGRDALRALLAHGAATLGWERVFIPTFFCQEVAAAMRLPRLELHAYADAPCELPVWPNDLGPGDVVLVINYFGLREGVDTKALFNCGVAIVEDHTHDPWSPWAWSSKADYCVVALRKTLPVPEGGVIWSPRKLALPEEPPVTKERQQAADSKRAAMLLKSLYLAGHAVSKDDFSTLFIEGEEHITSGAISGMTRATRAVLDCLPVENWREQRLRNYHVLATALERTPALRVLRPEGRDCVPFIVPIVTETPSLREILRVGLLARRVYPAVLWSLEEPAFSGVVPPLHVDLSRKILALHCDMRYGKADLLRVAKELIEI